MKIISSEETVITVKEARKILGKDYKSFSDDQILELIQGFSNMSNDFINKY